jgi:hypothetical protein
MQHTNHQAQSNKKKREAVNCRWDRGYPIDLSIVFIGFLFMDLNSKTKTRLGSNPCILKKKALRKEKERRTKTEQKAKTNAETCSQSVKSRFP